MFITSLSLGTTTVGLLRLLCSPRTTGSSNAGYVIFGTCIVSTVIRYLLKHPLSFFSSFNLLIQWCNCTARRTDRPRLETQTARRAQCCRTMFKCSQDCCCPAKASRDSQAEARRKGFVCIPSSACVGI
jgi:hypothetical protein